MEKLIKYFLIIVIGIAIGYAWRISHEVPLVEQGKGFVMAELYRAAEVGIPFMFCLEDTDKCMRFIPRGDSKNEIQRESAGEAVMDIIKIKIAKAEALRFFATVREVETRMKQKNGSEDVAFGTKETAACKRFDGLDKGIGRIKEKLLMSRSGVSGVATLAGAILIFCW